MPAVARGWRRCDEEKSRDLPKIVRRATKSKIKRCKQGSIEATSRIIAGSRDGSQWTSTEHTSEARGWIVASNPANAPRSTSARQSHFFFSFSAYRLFRAVSKKRLGRAGLQRVPWPQEHPEHVD